MGFNNFAGAEMDLQKGTKQWRCNTREAATRTGGRWEAVVQHEQQEKQATKEWQQAERQKWQQEQQEECLQEGDYPAGLGFLVEVEADTKPSDENPQRDRRNK